MVKAKLSSGLSNSSVRIQSRKNSVMWREDVLCTPQSTRPQIVSDLLFSFYELVNDETIDLKNVQKSLYAVKHSSYRFNETIGFDEPIETTKYGSIRLTLKFENQKTVLTIKIRGTSDYKRYKQCRTLISVMEGIQRMYAEL